MTHQPAHSAVSTKQLAREDDSRQVNATPRSFTAADAPQATAGKPAPPATVGKADTTATANPTEVSSRSRPTKRYGGYPGEVAYVKNASGKIALTFDAGASPAPTPSILDTLHANGLHVTFFVTGKWCEQNEELVARIDREGHEIADHTYSHLDMRKLSDEQIADQLCRTSDIVRRITGHGTVGYFRPPFGARDRRVLAAAADVGYRSVYWSLDCWDAYKKGITSQEVSKRVLERVQGGDIVLMHCGSQATADALPDLITELLNRGYQIVTVSELIGTALQ